MTGIEGGDGGNLLPPAGFFRVLKRKMNDSIIVAKMDNKEMGLNKEISCNMIEFFCCFFFFFSLPYFSRNYRSNVC